MERKGELSMDVVFSLSKNRSLLAVMVAQAFCQFPVVDTLPAYQIFTQPSIFPRDAAKWDESK